MQNPAGGQFSEPLVLASGSPRRRDLLTAYGYRFETVIADIHETAPAHLTVAESTLLNARAKAGAVARQRPDSVVLAADTLVALDGEPLGKPRDFAHAAAMLERLCGRSHEVYSGVWIVHRAAGKSSGFIELSRVHFRRLSPVEIDAYLQRIHPLDKAGAYAAQEDQGELIERIEGSRTNVIGLPMRRLAQALLHYVR